MLKDWKKLSLGNKVLIIGLMGLLTFTVLVCLERVMGHV
ncbi:hypothetical protein HDC90_001150 [Pedobacter sp. AK013]|nr:hypothetical protein [Pedobacter sp. AK013]